MVTTICHFHLKEKETGTESSNIFDLDYKVYSTDFLTIKFHPISLAVTWMNKSSKYKIIPTESIES